MHYHQAQAPVNDRTKKGWRKWAWNVLIGIDQLGNTLIAGDPDETISSRAGKDLVKGRRWARTLCWFLDKVDPGHCIESIDPTEGKDQVWR